MFLRSVVIGLLFAFSGNAYADGDTGPRNIVTYGCHKNDGTCYVILDGPLITGAPECAGNDIRWDAKNDVNGKTWLSIIMLAASTGQKISLHVSGCFGQFPAFSYGSVILQ